MTKIDIYTAHRLDPAAPPSALLQQLDNEASQTRDRLQRNRIATARAIIADPQRRATYDRYLADPSAEVTETTLAQISGRPVPSAGEVGSRNTKLALGIVAASVVLALVVAIVIVATAGGDENSPTNAAASSSAAASQQVEESAQASYDTDDLIKAKWPESSSSAPTLAVHLDAAYALPSGAITSLDNDTNCANANSCEIRQNQDKSIGVYTLRHASEAQPQRLITLDQQGTLISDTRYGRSDSIPPRFDRQEYAELGYFRVIAGDGMAIPPAAAGTESEMQFAMAILPDAFADNLFWVILRGGDTLYKATLTQP
ncbi:hypothetical protein ABLE94_02540 [Gordonia sp. VNK1]|uniref:hypothetical protein n=1 Tax=Gordonia oleivorans TaxID=3156618 RepID=UPI0032B32C3E